MEQPDLLILQLQQKNERAFERIYSMYSEAIHGIIYSIVLDESVAEEVLQDTFIKIWDNSAAYDIKKGRFFTWILNIARNTAIDKTRSKQFKNSKKNLTTTNFVDILQSSDNLNSTTNAIGIKKFVDKLKPMCIQIIELLFFQGYTQKDAAEKLEVPLGTLKTKNRTCLRDLRWLVIGPH